jgi:HAD superfamily hydrolase (TIGR01549 family)
MIGNVPLIIFDFDGTIVHLQTEWNVLRAALENYFQQMFHTKDTFSNIDESLLNIKRKHGENIYKKFVEIVAEYELIGYKGKKVECINSFLSSLIKEEKAIFSSNCRLTIEIILNKIGLSVDFIIAKEDVNIPKPNPEGLIKIFSHFNLKPQDAVFIGNAGVDIEAGASIGVKSLLIDDFCNWYEK